MIECDLPDSPDLLCDLARTVSLRDVAERVNDEHIQDVMRKAADAMERQEEALWRIRRWSQAYPVKVFPEPDADYLRRAHEALTANGMTLDRIAADCMRRVLQDVGKIARHALEGGPS